MSVRYGIVCDRCGILHLIPNVGKSSHIRYDRLRGEFAVSCIPPCLNVFTFQSQMLLPYVVTEQAVDRGYAGVDDYRPVAKIDKARARQ